MPGLPFGAAQSHDVPHELRSYDHVQDIEFIEVDPDLPYPRSAAYRKTADGAQMLVRRGAPDIARVDLTVDEARELIDALEKAGLFARQRVYKPSQGPFVNVVTEWRVEVGFDRPVARRTSTFRAEGADEFPDSFELVVDLLLSRAPETEDAEDV